MKEDKTVPQLRFPEFTDAWKQRKLGEIIDYSNGIGHENYVLPQGKYELVTLKSINSSGKLVCSEKFVNEDFETLKAETLIMMLSEQAKGMLGMTTIIPCDNKYVLNQRVAALKAHNDVEVHFLTNAINNKQNYFEQMGAGTKVQNITRGHVEECVIELPSLEEQKKIGSLFSKLEVTITLQQRKLNSLQKLKKGLLQKMFPKNGENIPKIRFPEFSDAWKQRKLGEIIDYSNGIGHENYVLPQGKYELVTLKSINSSGKLVCSEKFVNEDFETLKAETLIMMLSEQAKGMLGMTTIIPCDNKYVLNQRVAALKAHNDVEVHFLTNAINNKQNYFEQMGAGTKVQNITRGHVEECVIELPSLEEQKKIGSLFSKLEVTITLQQRKLESLQKLKKGLLQQMFI